MNVILESGYSLRTAVLDPNQWNSVSSWHIPIHCRRLSYADESRAEEEAGWAIMNSQKSLSRTLSLDAQTHRSDMRRPALGPDSFCQFEMLH